MGVGSHFLEELFIHRKIRRIDCTLHYLIEPYLKRSDYQRLQLRVKSTTRSYIYIL